MRSTTLRATGAEVTRLALGCAAPGSPYRPVSDARARAPADAAWAAGVRRFDTAPHHGLGLSERRLGAALRGRPRAEYTLSAEVGGLLVPDAGGGDDLASGFVVPAAHRRVRDFSADGCAAASRSPSSGWAWTTWTSPCCTTPPTMASRRAGRRTRHWSGCGPRGSYGPSAPG